MSHVDVVELSAAETLALRRAVLRDGDPDRTVQFPEDADPEAFHLGVRSAAGDIVAVSSWIPRPCPAFPGVRAIQLRGMATATEQQGSGLGGHLLEAGAQRCAELDAELLWARARDAALAFYRRHDCRVVGDGFIDQDTGLPHHLVVRELVSRGGG